MARILIIDDDETVLDLEKKILSDDGHDVLIAGDALIALDLLQLYGVDLIIVDIQMPRLNGFQFVTTIRNNPELKYISIAFLSSNNEAEIIAKAAKLGADFYLLKPIDRKNFSKKIKDFLENRPLKKHLKLELKHPVTVEAKIQLHADIIEVSEMGIKILTTQYLHEEQIVEMPSTAFRDIFEKSPLFKVLWVKPHKDIIKKAHLLFLDNNAETIKKVQKYIQSKKI